MESLIVNEFLIDRKILEKMGYEIVGTKDIDNENFYIVRKKKSD